VESPIIQAHAVEKFYVQPDGNATLRFSIMIRRMAASS
jgi:hypothetical protein